MKRALVILGSLFAVMAVITAAVLMILPGETSLARAGGELDGKNFRMKINLRWTEDGQPTSMVGTLVRDAGGGRVLMEVETTAPDASFHQTMVVKGKNMWVDTHESRELMPPGKRWVLVPQKALFHEDMGISRYLNLLKESDDVEAQGERTVRGRRVTVYRGKVSTRAVLEATAGDTLEAEKQKLGGRDNAAPVEAWIADDGRLERLMVKYTAGRDTTTEIYDAIQYGVAADVKVPPESQVISEEEWNTVTAG